MECPGREGYHKGMLAKALRGEKSKRGGKAWGSDSSRGNVWEERQRPGTIRLPPSRLPPALALLIPQHRRRQPRVQTEEKGGIRSLRGQRLTM